MSCAASLTLHLDLVGGLAGDMFVAALVDALPELEIGVAAALAAVRPVGAPEPRWSEATSGGLRAKRFGVDAAALTYGRREPARRSSASRSSPYRAVAAKSGVAVGAEARIGAASGTSYVTLRRHVEGAALPALTREHALALLARLAEAEAHVHGVAIEQVHFHEIGDWDSLMDVVAAASIAAQLHGARWTASSLPLGGGTVDTAHGVLPVPVPATAWLLSGYRWHDDGRTGERVTPTGAAILRHLVDPVDCGGRHDAGVLLASGQGAGTRVLPSLPNIVRVLVIGRDDASSQPGSPARRDERRQAAADTGAFAACDQVSSLEFDVDDMTGEEIAIAADHLRSEPGVLDVSIGTRFGKKGRAVADFRVLAASEVVTEVARACFSETSTLGLRLREERRLVLQRSETVQAIDGEEVRVKVALRPGGQPTAKAEHDDVASRRGLSERRSVRSAATRRVLKRRD